MQEKKNEKEKRTRAFVAGETLNKTGTGIKDDSFSLSSFRETKTLALEL